MPKVLSTKKSRKLLVSTVLVIVLAPLAIRGGYVFLTTGGSMPLGVLDVLAGIVAILTAAVVGAAAFMWGLVFPIERWIKRGTDD